MPPLSEQIAMPGSFTVPDFFGARLLLKPGRKYEDAVKQFSPYNRIQDPYPEGRAAGVKLIKEGGRRGGATQAFIYVNNRFEGNALQTNAAMVDTAGQG
jgi:hypothetical protein